MTRVHFNLQGKARALVAPETDHALTHAHDLIVALAGKDADLPDAAQDALRRLAGKLGFALTAEPVRPDWRELRRRIHASAAWGAFALLPLDGINRRDRGRARQAIIAELALADDEISQADNAGLLPDSDERLADVTTP